jgi:hypothetical protein
MPTLAKIPSAFPEAMHDVGYSSGILVQDNPHLFLSEPIGI